MNIMTFFCKDFYCPNCKVHKVEHKVFQLVDKYHLKSNIQGHYEATVEKVESKNEVRSDLAGTIAAVETYEDKIYHFCNINGSYLYEIECKNCNFKRIVYFDNYKFDIPKTIYPILPEGKPLPDCMPEDLRKDFDEARLIVNYSVRCAVGLLRICGEKLCNFIADRYITDKDIKQEIIEKQNKLQPKINLLVKYRKDYFSFIDEKYIQQLEIVKDAGNSSLHARNILDEYTKNDFDALYTIIIDICNTIATKEENDDKRINALKEKNDINDPKKR